MAINKAGLFRPKFGALFTAADGISPIAVITSFLLTGVAPPGWNHWGHLSRSTLPSVNTNSGDSTSLGTWLQENTDTFTADPTESIEYTLNQMDALTIAGLSALHGHSVSALELWSSGPHRCAKWVPSAKGAWSQQPVADGVDDYASMKFTLSVQQPDPSLGVAALADPDNGIAPYPTITAPTMLFFDYSVFE